MKDVWYKAGNPLFTWNPIVANIVHVDDNTLKFVTCFCKTLYAIQRRLFLKYDVLTAYSNFETIVRFLRKLELVKIRNQIEKQVEHFWILIKSIRDSNQNNCFVITHRHIFKNVKYINNLYNIPCWSLEVWIIRQSFYKKENRH